MKALVMWVIYRHPRDYPSHFVAREWSIDKSGSTSLSAFLANTLEGARLGIPKGLVRIDRSPSDSPHIVEAWL